MKIAPFLLVILFLATGCDSVYRWKDPKVDLSKRRLFYVEAELSDGKNLHLAIADELRRLGYPARSGVLTMIPDSADTLVSYQSRWTWDFSTYLIELNIQVRDVQTGRILASSGYHRPAVDGTSTEDLIHKVVTSIFPPKQKQPAPPVRP